METATEEKDGHGEIETAHLALSGNSGNVLGQHAQEYRRIDQQAFIDTSSRLAFAKLCDRKNAVVAADMLNDSVYLSLKSRTFRGYAF